MLLSSNSVFGPKVDSTRVSVINQDQYAFIKCFILFVTPALEVYVMLVRVAWRNALSEIQVYKLYKEFKEGVAQAAKMRTAKEELVLPPI